MIRPRQPKPKRAKKKADPVLMVGLTETDFYVLCEVTNILTDGWWDDPEEPGHGENVVAWANLMLKVRKAFRAKR